MSLIPVKLRTARVSRLRCRGTASVEAVIVLPTLIVILCGVLYVSRSITERHRAEDLARSCAWRYSANGCAGMPDECSGFVKRKHHEVDVIGLVTSAGERVGDDFESAYAATEGGFEGLVASIVADAFGDLVTKSMQQDAKGTVDYKVSRQGLGADIEDLTVHYQIPCNLKPQTVTSVVEDAWKHVISSKF